MKNISSTVKKIVLFVSIVTLILILTSCKYDYLEYKMPFYDPEFDPNSHQILEKDEGIVIDGVLNEDIWTVAENNEFSLSSTFKEDIELRSKCYVGSKGVYFGLVAYDYAVYYNAERPVTNNSGAEIYFCGVDGNKIYNIRIVPTGDGCEIASDRITWRWDMERDEWRGWKLRWEGAATVQGIMNSNDCQGYTVEVFIPWESIGEPSEYIRYMTAFNHVESTSVTDSERTWTGSGRTTYPYTWSTVNNDGIFDHDTVMDSLVEYDENMTVDGVLDEDVWADKETIYYSTTNAKGDLISLEGKYYGTEMGAYFGFVVKDKYIYYADESVRSIGLNSGLELMFAPAGTDHVTVDCAQLRVTANGVVERWTGYPFSGYPWTMNHFRAVAATTIQGELNATDVSGNEGYTVEVFVPWDSIGLKEQPESILLGASLLHNENATGFAKVLPWRYINLMSYEISLKHNPSACYAEMTNDGPVSKVMDMPNVWFTNKDVVDGYYVKTVDFKVSPTIVHASCTGKKTVVVPELTVPDFVEYTANADNTVTFKVPVSRYEELIDGVDFTAQYDGMVKTGKIIYNKDAVIDGVLDDEIWENSEVYHSSRDGRTQDIKLIVGEKGIHIAYDVVDPDMRVDSRIESWLSLGDRIDLNDMTYHFRFYPLDNSYPNGRIYVWDDSVNLSNGQDFLEITDRGIAWNSATKLVTDSAGKNIGYTVEAYIPFAAIGIEKAPEVAKYLSVQFYWNGGKEISAGHSKEVPFMLVHVMDYAHYQSYGAGGFIDSLNTGDIVLDNAAHLIGGSYVNDFVLIGGSGNPVSGATFSGFGSEYFTELGAGKYRVSIPEDKKADFAEPRTITVTSRAGVTAEFKISIVEVEGVDPEVEIKFDNGEIVNTGTSTDVTVGDFTINGDNGTNKNGTQFVETDSMTFTDGLGGEANGAAVSNHRKGPYTVVQGMNLGTCDFTISAWFRIPVGEEVSTGNSSYMFGTSAADFTANKGLMVTVRNTNGQFFLCGRAGSSGAQWWDTQLDMDLGEWNLLTVVRQGTSVRYYLNDTLILTQTISENYDFGTYDISFGGQLNETWQYIDSTVNFDNIRIYDRAIGVAELTKIVNTDPISE